MEAVRLHVQSYQDKGTRDAQNAEMLIQCLRHQSQGQYTTKYTSERKVYNH